MSQQEDLTRFRTQIDAIDDKIIDLLKGRMEVVKQVGEYKAKHSTTSSFIRAGREASMLRNLTQKIDGKFPPAAIAAIWRTIISTSLCTEQHMSISSYVTEKDQSCYWLAREYFGTFIENQREDSADKVISNVANGKTAIGILPLFDNSYQVAFKERVGVQGAEDASVDLLRADRQDRSTTTSFKEGGLVSPSPWWIRPSSEKNDTYIFARIPFVEEHDPLVTPVLAIANVMPEKTDDDISVLAVYTKKPTAEIKKAFAANGLNANIIAEKNGTDYLIEADKFINIGDAALGEITGKLGDGAFVRLMGAYAVPISG